MSRILKTHMMGRVAFGRRPQTPSWRYLGSSAATSIERPGSVFMLTVLRRDAGETRRSRTWAWFARFADAERVVLDNETDVFEHGHYNMAVVERYDEGLLTVPDFEAWYVVTDGADSMSPTVRRIEKPEDLAQVVCFAIG